MTEITYYSCISEIRNIIDRSIRNVISQQLQIPLVFHYVISSTLLNIIAQPYRTSYHFFPFFYIPLMFIQASISSPLNYFSLIIQSYIEVQVYEYWQGQSSLV